MAITRKTSQKKQAVARKAAKPPTKARTRRAKASTGRPPKSGYAPVSGLSMYYELHGKGAPLVLLHGGVGGIDMFGPNLAALARDRQVIAVDFQGHGHTSDIDRPLRYESMADDIAALMEFLGVEKADVMGHSLGGGIALNLAIRHRHLVRKLVLSSTAFRQDAWYPEIQAAFAQMGPEAAQWINQSPLASLYPEVDWGVLFTKIGELETRAYDYSEDVAALPMPTLLVFADTDSVPPREIVEAYRLLGGGQRDAGLDGSGRSRNQLAILPGVTHYTIDSSPSLAAAVIPFLDAPLT